MLRVVLLLIAVGVIYLSSPARRPDAVPLAARLDAAERALASEATGALARAALDRGWAAGPAQARAVDDAPAAPRSGETWSLRPTLAPPGR